MFLKQVLRKLFFCQKNYKTCFLSLENNFLFIKARNCF